MTTTQANNGQPVMNLTALSLESAVYNGNPVRVDLGAAAPLEYGGIMVTAQTYNPANSTTGMTVCFGFCHEELAPAVAAERLQSRVKTITCSLITATGYGDTRDFASAKEPVGGRYLYIWWETPGGGNPSDTVDLNVWVQFLK